MTSVNSGTGAAVYRTGTGAGPNLGNTWAFCWWIGIDSYSGSAGTSSIWVHGLNSGTARFEVRTVATGELHFQWYQDGGVLTDSVTISTGSNTGWVCLAASHALAATTIDVAWRREGESSWTTDALSAPALSAGAGFPDTESFIAWDGATALAVGRSVKAWSTDLSMSGLLDESASLDAVVNSGSLFCFLDYDSTTNLGDDLGPLGNDFSVFGSPADDAREPDASLGGGGVPPPPLQVLQFGSNF